MPSRWRLPAPSTRSPSPGARPGEFLTGAAGGINGGGGDVTLTDVIPDLAAQSVTVWGHSNPGAVPGAYEVVATAICVPRGAGQLPAGRVGEREQR
jgi:hypothetical protein